MTGLAEGQLAQSGTESAPGLASIFLADSRASRRANASCQPETALPAGSSAQGRASSRAPGAGASSRAPWPVKKGPPQPAFIRIADDTPRTSHRAGPSSSAFSRPRRDNQQLSTAAQTDAGTTKLAQSKLGSQALAASAWAASRSAGASLATQSLTPTYTRTVSAVPAAQAAAVAVDCTSTIQQSPDAHQLTIAEYAGTHSAVVQAQTAVPIAKTMTHVHESAETAAAAGTAASGAPVSVTSRDATALLGIPTDGIRSIVSESAGTAAVAETAADIAAGTAPSPMCTIMPHAAAKLHEGAITNTPAAVGTLIPGSVRTPVLTAGCVGTPTAADVQGSGGAVQHRAVLPSSRRKRKGPKAVKALEPVKAEPSWQALLGPDNGANSEAPARTHATGMRPFLAIQRFLHEHCHRYHHLSGHSEASCKKAVSGYQHLSIHSATMRMGRGCHVAMKSIT